MIALFKKFAFEFSVFSFFSLMLDLFGLHDWTNTIGAIVLSSLFRKFMPYSKGEDFELDERLKSNAETAGLMTLAYITVLFGVIFCYLRYIDHPLSTYVLFLVLSIYIVYMCFLAISMRRN